MGLKQMAASIGGGIGVIGIILFKLCHVQSPALGDLLWPSRILTAGYQGENPWTTGVLVGIVDFVGNVAIYAVLGFAIGWLVETAQSRRIKD